MKQFITFLKQFMKTEVFRYLFFGVVTTLVYMLTRFILFAVTESATFSAAIANLTAVIFAFVTNDLFVFNQVRQGWFSRFIKFFTARLSTFLLDIFLAWFFVKTFPGIIGQFVNNNLQLVDLIETIIAQVLIMLGNYFISKLLVFKDKK